MFEVIFEVHPSPAHFSTYLSIAANLRPILESQRGFIANVRYRSLTRPGWILSLSDWEDEKALIRWRTQGGHHGAQEKGRQGVLMDYHLRVGEVFVDHGQGRGDGSGGGNGNVSGDGNSGAEESKQQRFDETEIGEAKVISLVNVRMQPLDSDDSDATREAPDVLDLFAFSPKKASGLVSWDAFDAILTPGETVLLCAWKDLESAVAFGKDVALSATRMRHVRVIRDYSMLDRREVPQYYPEVKPLPS